MSGITYKKFRFGDNMGDSLTVHKCYLDGQPVGEVFRNSSRDPWECVYKKENLGKFFKKHTEAIAALEGKINEQTTT
jgi:hypothetical protein